MSPPSILSHLGVFTEDNFLEATTCEHIIASMRAGAESEAKVYGRHGERRVDSARRQTARIVVKDDLREMLRTMLLERLPVFESQFDQKLSRCQAPEFLIYRPGDFFEPHQDCSSSTMAPEEVRQRKVSVVLFLNDEGATENGFDGGSLAFFGLLKDSRCREIGIPVAARAGRLVAFRSEVFHQVTPVTQGERFSMVTWLS